MTRRASVSCAILASCVALLAGPAQGQIPTEFTNLQLLDPEIARTDLIGTMRDWAGGLGVRCNHCHVGPDNLVGMDFASDEKATKRAARRMLVMARSINGELLAGLPTVEEDASHQVVSCYTCHRGQSKPPRSIAVALNDVAASDGVDAALGHYDALRAEHYGAGVYDFSESALSAAAGYLVEAGRPADALEVLAKNLEYHPESADVHSFIGMVHLQGGDTTAAKAALDRALEIDPENRGAARGMQMLQASPPNE